MFWIINAYSWLDMSHFGQRRPARSTFCGVDHSWVNVSRGTSPAIGKKSKMPPPPLLTRTIVTGGCIPPAQAQKAEVTFSSATR